MRPRRHTITAALALAASLSLASATRQPLAPTPPASERTPPAPAATPGDAPPSFWVAGDRFVHNGAPVRLISGR